MMIFMIKIKLKSNKIEIIFTLHSTDTNQTTMTSTNRLDLLPEELSQHIYKFVFNNALDGIIKKKKKDYGPYGYIKITYSITKKEGYWYDKIKENSNLVFFKINRMKHMFNNYSFDTRRNLVFCGKENYSQRVALDYAYKGKEYLTDQLLLNGYVMYDKANEDFHINKKKKTSIKFMYKTWSCKRMFKELMSF